MRLFAKKYKKRSDNKLWTRKTLLIEMQQLLPEYGVEVDSNNLTVTNDEYKISFDFFSDNYSNDDTIGLNANVCFIFKDGIQEWTDLFHLIKSLQEKYSRPLSIHKDESWIGSSFEKDFSTIIKPLIKVLLDKKQTKQFLKGEKVSKGLQLNQKNEYSWILESSSCLAEKF